MLAVLTLPPPTCRGSRRPSWPRWSGSSSGPSSCPWPTPTCCIRPPPTPRAYTACRCRPGTGRRPRRPADPAARLPRPGLASTVLMAARPRLLFLAQCLPYPPHSGVASRTFNILKQLQVEYDVDLVAFSRVCHQPDRVARQAAWDALRSAATFVAEPTPIPDTAPRKIWDHLRSVFSGRAYTYYEYESDAFADRLHAVLRTRTPDLVHLDSVDLHRWLPDLGQVPITCTHHNIESELLRRRAQHPNQRSE